MCIVKKGKYKKQCIEIIREESLRESVYKYRIKYFPKKVEGSCAWKMLQCPTKFPNIVEAIKEAKLRINTEFENGNWVEPTQEIFKDCEHEI